MSKRALLIIDVQQAMFNEGEQVHNANALLQTITTLKAKAESMDIPVFLIQHEALEGKPLELGTTGWEIHPRVKGGTVIHKMTPDSFHQTDLHEQLQTRGVEELFLTGIQSEVCVDTTCRRAFSMGYKVTLVSDAHSTWDSGVLKAEDIIHHHNGVLRWFADVAQSSHIIENWENERS
ncbi:isochorismatase [Rossellomorea marisflavi]|uniref:cysteine hydrolase family protein n=1 Tax=Rossellomorea marisflavi TaxID=189381 RepID=UPI0025C85E00|nr:cysteine hydrolase family protein [Rossellomorea marisflavi]GLI85225.1 isochorismatase [Rossellomorea marisflavi]